MIINKKIIILIEEELVQKESIMNPLTKYERKL